MFFLSAPTQQDIVLTALSELSYLGTTVLTFHPHWPGLCSCIHFVMFWLVPAGIRPKISHVPSMFSCLCAALLCREIRLREESAERRKLSPSCVKKFQVHTAVLILSLKHKFRLEKWSKQQTSSSDGYSNTAFMTASSVSVLLCHCLQPPLTSHNAFLRLRLADLHLSSSCPWMLMVPWLPHPPLHPFTFANQPPLADAPAVCL